MENENFSVDLKIRISPTQDRALESEAGKRSTKKATIVRQAIQEFLTRELPGYPERYRVASPAEKTSPKATVKRKVGTPATIFRDVYLGDGPAGLPCVGEFRPESWEERITVNLRQYPGAAFALRVHGVSMTGAGIQEGDVLVFALPEPDADLAGQVVAACIDGDVTIKTLVKRNGKTTLRAENPAYPDVIVTPNSSVQGVMVGKPIRQRRKKKTV